MTVDYRVGDVRERMAEIPDGSISLVASSPPFLALRSYLPAGHESKGDEIGSEPNPAAFLDTLLALTAEWGRVLAPWGSIAIELGDTFSGSGGGGGDYSADGLRAGQPVFDGSGKRIRETRREGYIANGVEPPGRRDPLGWPGAKSLALIPQLYAVALAYGINPLTGIPSPAGRWLVRNVIVWHRPNPAVGALGDKFRPSTSYITVATRARDRWFDLDAVRVRGDRAPHTDNRGGHQREGIPGRTRQIQENSAGAPPLDTWFDEHDTWTITAQPSRLAHYAMWPPKLAERLILSMCPEWVCSVCGEPRRRHRTGIGFTRNHQPGHERRGGVSTHSPDLSEVETLGWSDCLHDGLGTYRYGVVLDPFSGSGTTLAVAHLHGRGAIGIDIDARNADLYPARLAECRRALFGTLPEMAGQTSLFGETT